ncbi:MAG: hypothetical protein QXU82_00550 [Candidatus Aenigmatarchaeota archaeon]
MPAVGMKLKLINASKSEDFEGMAGVENRTKIKDVREKDIPMIGKKGLEITFVFDVEYKKENGKSFAMIEMEGDVFYLGEDDKKVLEMWAKEKKIPEALNIDVLNTILRKCITKSLELSDDLQLPPSIALPYARIRPPEKK